MDELPGVLWAYRTTTRIPTDMSLFTLTYGMEAIVPIEISMPTLRIDIPEQSNTKYVIKDLNMEGKLREAAAVRIAFVYSTVSDVSMSDAMFKEDENIKQRLVFFISKSLVYAETRYNHLEQAALALRVATKKLHPYFQVHPIVMLTDLPLRGTIHKPDLSERMAQ